MNRYPDASMQTMHQVVANAFSISTDFGLMFGNGSDELIQMLLMAINKDSKVLSPEPSFVMYQHLATLLDHEYIELYVIL